MMKTAASGFGPIGRPELMETGAAHGAGEEKPGNES